MKLVISCFFFITSLILISCSGEDVQKPTEEETVIEKPSNKAPSPPKLKFPENNLACTYSTMTFEWEPSTDPEGTAIRYELELAKKQSFEDLYESVKTSNAFVTLDLDKGSGYYWRVLSIDQEGKESNYSEIRSFYTEPSLTYNSIPQNPNSEIPLNNSTVDQSLSLLEWSSIDEDGDALSFDVYFGITNPPPLVMEDLKETSYEISLSEFTTYYWQIIAKDTQGAKAIGPIWKFNIH